MTLSALVKEFLSGARLQSDYAWVHPKFKAEDRSRIELTLDDAQRAAVRAEADAHSDYADGLLYDHCEQCKIDLRALSRNDMDLLATAIVLRAVIATDEWPLKFVVDDLTRNNDEDDYGIQVFTSIHMLKVLEDGQFLTADERRATMKSWLRSGEILPREWHRDYWQLFKEAPPLAS